MKKKLFLIMTCFCIFVLLTACGGSGKSDESAETTENETASALESDHATIEGVYVNDSYVDEDNPSLKMVYVFYDIHTNDSNFELSSMANLKTDANTYAYEKSTNSVTGANYMSSYHYDNSIVDVFSGENKKMLSTFRVPEGDIPGDGTFHLINSNVPDLETIEIKSDNITHCENPEEIAKLADPEGYSKEVELQKEADEETATKVQDGINGYKWDFFVNNVTMTIEFFAPNKFTLSLAGTETGSGTYTVKNGYVSVKYDSNGEVVDIPWYEKNGEIDLKPQVAYAF